jgi:hypothetical protein
VGDFTTGVANLMGTNVSASTTTMARNGGVGELSLNGGTLTTQLSIGATPGNIVNFNGGVLASRANDVATLISGTNATDASMYLWGAANASSGGLVIDSHSNSSSINSPLLSPAYNVVTSLNITASGSGYTSSPTVSFAGGGGSGAVAVVTLSTAGSVNGFSIVNPGVGYTAAPTVSLAGGLSATGSAATISTTLSANSGVITIPFNNNTTTNAYFGAPPIVQIFPATAVVSGNTLTGGGAGASAIANMSANGRITSITITNPGTNYNSFVYLGTTYRPTVALYGGTLMSSTDSYPTFGSLVTGTNANSAGGLTLNGGGTVTVSSSQNTYAGNTILNAGKLNLTGMITTSPTWNITALGSVNVNGTGAVLTAPTSINATGSIMGTGVVTTATLNAAGLVDFGGTLNVTTAINVLSGGQLNANAVVNTPTVNVLGGGGLGGGGSVINGTSGGLVSVVLAASSNSDAGRGAINTVNGVAGTLTLGGNLTVGGGTLYP